MCPKGRRQHPTRFLPYRRESCPDGRVVSPAGSDLLESLGTKSAGDFLVSKSSSLKYCSTTEKQMALRVAASLMTEEEGNVFTIANSHNQECPHARMITPSRSTDGVSLRIDFQGPAGFGETGLVTISSRHSWYVPCFAEVIASFLSRSGNGSSDRKGQKKGDEGGRKG